LSSFLKVVVHCNILTGTPDSGAFSTAVGGAASVNRKMRSIKF